MYNGLHKDFERDKCRNKIRKVRLPHKDGVVGICVYGMRFFNHSPISSPLSFCPSNVCCKFPSRKVTGLPPIPRNLLVLVGTSLMEEEVKYLFLQGLSFGGLNPNRSDRDVGGYLPPTFAAGATFGSPTLLVMRIDVNSYLEKPNFCEPEKRLQSRNGKVCNSQNSLLECHRKKIALSTATYLIILQKDEIQDGNAWGIRLYVRNEESRC